ncbi:MAG TPA: (2Fe-2S)-binding protein [Acidobacteriaceae bacterium]|jgi:aerobic-type carbon monoxide dehydrogenase small subunit (CoxS/CutS family)|nr:(2Fe-2S)-binding protein [Acidobacteriaceae bacterium]
MSERDDSRPAVSDSAEQSPANEKISTGISRRGFLKGAGITAAGTALLEGVQVFSREAVAATTNTKNVRELGPGPVPVTLHINGKEHVVQIEPRTTLADALRMQLGMTGTKVVCDRGSCSACTVLLDKTPVNSCMMLAVDVGPRKITTIEGISHNGEMHPLQAAFVKHDAMQCGFCTPGMVMSCASLLEHNPKPTEADVRQAVSGNLCRCGTYPKVFAATLEAAGVTTQNA